MYVPNKDLRYRIGELEKKIEKIKKNIETQDVHTTGQYFQTIGFAALAISVTFILAKIRNETTYVLFAIGLILIVIAFPLAVVIRKIGDRVLIHSFALPNTINPMATMTNPIKKSTYPNNAPSSTSADPKTNVEIVPIDNRTPDVCALLN